MRTIQYMLLCLAVAFTVHVCAAQTQDAKGCKDSQLISRFPGSVISSCKQTDDDVFSFEMGPGKPDKKIEGKFLNINYNYPHTASKAQVLRNLKTCSRPRDTSWITTPAIMAISTCIWAKPGYTLELA